ncbi:hypothetical protein [Streptomyces sp. NPDC091268]|uniref:hypothetical protein n=1 Tax=Streptomyces sp. NPDC091268 TaxID=3365979 RepID=UPI0037F6CA0D
MGGTHDERREPGEDRGREEAGSGRPRQARDARGGPKPMPPGQDPVHPGPGRENPRGKSPEELARRAPDEATRGREGDEAGPEER